MKKYGSAVITVALGAALYGLGICVFINPQRVLMGGATGLATVLEIWFRLPLGLGLLLINLPLVLLAYFFLGKRTALFSMLGTVILSVSLEIFALMPPFQGDRLLSVLSGAALSGAGTGLLCGKGVTTGGSDLLALLLQKKFPALSFGGMVLIIDVAVVLLGGLVYGELETVLYSVLLATVYTVVLNTYLKGRTAGRMVWIVSAKELAAIITREAGRGVTVLQGKGGYTGDGRAVLLCALATGEEKKLRKIVYHADPAAFMVVAEATEILGFGFADPGKEKIQ
ncbi:MAG: YitT family protein [Clostridia bacterium]|nr:YitT family protein [Clostridia bacterium]